MNTFLKIAGGYLGANWIGRKLFLSKSFQKEDALTYPRYTTIIMPALNEERYIAKALNSLFEQNIIQDYPNYFEIIVIDNGSIDNTYNIISQYPIKILHESRKGVLYAKDKGIRDAKGEIIVSTNADIIYPPNWLNLLLKSFNEDINVVGVSGVSFNDGIVGALTPTSGLFIQMPFFIGSNHAFYRQYYEKIPYNLSVNQLSLRDVIQEEEIGFAHRLSQYGKVIKNWKAASIASARRLFPLQDLKFTQEIMNKQRFGEKVGYFMAKSKKVKCSGICVRW